MVAYLSNRRMSSRLKEADSYDGRRSEEVVTLTYESTHPIEQLPGNQVKIVNIVRQPESSPHEVILNFPNREERRRCIRSGAYKDLTNTRWCDNETCPMIRGVRYDFYGYHLGRCQHNSGEYWFLWRLVDPETLQTRELIAFDYDEYSYDLMGHESPDWYVDDSEYEPASEWISHSISFEERELTHVDYLIVTLHGLGPDPLSYT